MSDYPLVSIITPSYNQAAFLEQTIQSVLQQEYPNLEYWVIDGASTDGSVEIIKKYAGSLAGWVSEKDQGQAHAINKGFERAHGEVIAWLNSDDLYKPDAVSSAVKALQVHPEAGMVFTDVESIDAHGEAFNLMHYGDWGLHDLMTFHIIGQPAVFMRRSVLEQAGHLDLSYKYLLDHHLWLRMGLHADIQYIPNQVWAAARMHPGAKNVSQTQGFGIEAYHLVKWMMEAPAFLPHIHQRSKQIWAGAHRLNAFYLLDGGQPAQALKAYWRAFWQYPPAVFKDWRRILYAAFAPLGFQSLKKDYLERRKTRYQYKDKL